MEASDLSFPHKRSAAAILCLLWLANVVNLMLLSPRLGRRDEEVADSLVVDFEHGAPYHELHIRLGVDVLENLVK